MRYQMQAGILLSHMIRAIRIDIMENLLLIYFRDL